MNYYQNFNPYFQPYNQPYNKIQQPVQQTMEQFVPQPIIQNKPINLLGKSVDSIEVVKAMDIPLDRKYKLFSVSRW